MKSNLLHSVRTAFFTGIALGLAFWAAIPAGRAEDDLEKGFRNPPGQAHPLAWWHWINGNVTKEGIAADLADMKRVGIAGVQMFDVSMYTPPGPARYGSDLWHDDVQFAIRTAEKLGLEFSLENSPGWSASGGPWVTPDRSMKELVWSETTVDGPTAELRLPPRPFARFGFYRDIAILAVPADPPEADLLRTPRLLHADTADSSALRFEFDSAVDLSQLAVALTEPSGRCTIKGFIEGSLDGTRFKPLGDFEFVDQAGMPAQLIAPFKLARAKFVRLKLTATQGGHSAHLAFSEIRLGNPSRLTGWTSKLAMTTAPLFRPPERAGAELPLIARSEVIDLTSRLRASGAIGGHLPAGRWTLLRFGFTSTGSTNHPAVPEGHGLEIDKLDPAAVAFYFDRALGRIIREAGPRAGRTFKGVLFDSFEGGPQNWTDSFPEQFRRLRGYDLIPYLPVLTGRVIESAAFSECVLADFRRSIQAMLAEDYFGTMRRLAHEHGLETYGEAYGGPLDPAVDDADIDVPMGEFWMPDSASAGPKLKLVTSSAHFLNRKIIAAESFTAKPDDGRWNAVPSNLKNPGDYAFTAGINRFAIHDYTHQPVTAAAPGFTLGRYGTQFGRLNTWWPYAGAWIDYLSRSQFLLQRGVTRADVCFLLDEDFGYGFPSRLVEVPPGYDYEICYPRTLATMSFEAGAIRSPGGTAYRLVVLPRANWAADVDTLRHLRDLVRAGATILGDPPQGPAGAKDYLENRPIYRQLVAELWDGLDGRQVLTKPVGKGLVCRGMDPGAVLDRIGVTPEIGWSGWQLPESIRFIHRVEGDSEIYFIFNHSANAVAANFDFRMQGKTPELWNAVTGTVGPAAIFNVTGGRTTVPLQLEPHGSMFVIFRRPLPARWAISAPTEHLKLYDGRWLAAGNQPVGLRYSSGPDRSIPARTVPAPVAVRGPWDVAFLDGRGAPPHADFPTLASWTENSDPAIRYYSGRASYRTRFELPAGAVDSSVVALLDLGQVADIAELKVNGHSVGVLWQPPFQADVSRWLRPGENTLEIQVADRWINRLIGDEKIPVPYTYEPFGAIFTGGALQQLPNWLYDPSKAGQRTRVSFTSWRHYTVDSPLVPAGLLGPVSLEYFVAVDP